MPKIKLDKVNNSKWATFIAIMAKKDAINKLPNPVKTANFRPLLLAMIDAGIEPAATPKIINVIGSVAKDGLSVISLATIPPINTIIGAEHIIRGCAINNRLMFGGKLNLRVKNKAVIIISTKVRAIININ